MDGCCEAIALLLMGLGGWVSEAPKNPLYCRMCGTTTNPTRERGQNVTSPNCGHASLIPVPDGVSVPTDPTSPPLSRPATFYVFGVNRTTHLDVQLAIDADSEANAKVKAERQGVVVTSVLRA